MFSSKKFFPAGSGIVILISAAFFSFGCSTLRTTDPARTAREQLLLSTATDRALKFAVLDLFRDKKVFVDETYFDSYDSKYVIGTVRDALSRAGALLVATAANSDITVEARSGALSTDSATSLFGIPSTGVPIPLTGAIQLPEIAFYKSERDHSIAKIALLAYTTQSREHLYSSGPLVGKSFDNFYHVLGFSHDSTDIPEKKDHVKNADKYESWAPFYSEAALGSISVHTITVVTATNAPVANTNAPVAPANAPVAGTNAPAAAGTNSVSK